MVWAKTSFYLRQIKIKSWNTTLFSGGPKIGGKEKKRRNHVGFVDSLAKLTPFPGHMV